MPQTNFDDKSILIQVFNWANVDPIPCHLKIYHQATMSLSLEIPWYKIWESMDFGWCEILW